ncbi:MAG TPA: FtsQ-type POTRA domain-containing protein [Enterococcus sp.]|nr:FtsQ-type POTRA domain-containing protein [Enterococcus sp.]HPR80610.1 FtsQ-type POTRA domain-containing protein [Enterococcus sp.]
MTPWQKEHLLYLEKTGQVDSTIQLEEEEKIEESTDEVEVSEEIQEESDERVSFADRLPKIKEYRSKKLYQRLFLLILLFLLPLLGTLYYISPLSKVSAITVMGNQKVPTETIVNESNLKNDESLWAQFFNRKTTVQQIKEKAPRVEHATIQIVHWNQLQINVTEYQEVAWLVEGKEYLPILASGYVIQEPQKEAGQDKVIFEGFKDKKVILRTLKAYDKLPKEIQEGISQVKYAPTKSNDQLLNLYMNDGNQVIVNISNMSSQMEYYPQVAKEMDKKGVIDMEVGIFAYPYQVSESTIETTAEEKK